MQAKGLKNKHQCVSNLHFPLLSGSWAELVKCWYFLWTCAGVCYLVDLFVPDCANCSYQSSLWAGSVCSACSVFELQFSVCSPVSLHAPHVASIHSSSIHSLDSRHANIKCFAGNVTPPWLSLYHQILIIIWMKFVCWLSEAWDAVVTQTVSKKIIRNTIVWRQGGCSISIIPQLICN